MRLLHLHAFFYSLLWLQVFVNSEVLEDNQVVDVVNLNDQGVTENATEPIPNNRTCGQKLETYVMEIMNKNFNNVSLQISKT